MTFSVKITNTKSNNLNQVIIEGITFSLQEYANFHNLLDKLLMLFVKFGLGKQWFV